MPISSVDAERDTAQAAASCQQKGWWFELCPTAPPASISGVFSKVAAVDYPSSGGPFVTAERYEDSRPDQLDHIIFEVRKPTDQRSPCRIVAGLAGGSKVFSTEEAARAAYKKAGIPYPVEETVTIRGQKATACRGIEGNLVAGPPAFEPFTDNIVSVVFQSECSPAQITVTHDFVTALATPLPSGAQVKLTSGQVPTVQEMADWIDGWTFFGSSC